MYKKFCKSKMTAVLLLSAILLTACSHEPAKDIRSAGGGDSLITPADTGQTPSGTDIAANKEVPEATDSENLAESAGSEDSNGTKATAGESPKRPENTNDTDISMEEAIRIAEMEAERYYDNLKLTEIHSYDNDAVPDTHAGSDGAREWWYVNFGNESLNYVSILIRDGEICDVHVFDENGNNGLFKPSEIRLTSAEAVRKAKEAGLQGGNPSHENEWISGFHFKVEYGSLAKSPEDRRIFFEVIGVSPDRNFAHVDLDAATGELLLAQEQIEYENGETVWKPFRTE